MTIDRAFRLAAEYASEGRQAEIWADGRRVWPRMDAASEVSPRQLKAQAGRASLLLLVLALLALSVGFIAGWTAARGLLFFPDGFPAGYPAIQEGK